MYSTVNATWELLGTQAGEAKPNTRMDLAMTAVGSDMPGAALYVTAKPIDTSTGIYAQAGKVPPLDSDAAATPHDGSAGR